MNDTDGNDLGHAFDDVEYVVVVTSGPEWSHTQTPKVRPGSSSTQWLESRDELCVDELIGGPCHGR